LTKLFDWILVPKTFFRRAAVLEEKRMKAILRVKRKGFKSFDLADCYKCDFDTIGALQQGWMRKNSNGEEQCEKFEWQESH